jgi:hypothetical protein
LEFLARKLLKSIDEKSIFLTAAIKVDVGLKNESGAGTYCSFLSPYYWTYLRLWFVILSAYPVTKLFLEMKPMKPYWHMSPASAVLVLIKKLTLSKARAFNAGVV